MILTNLLVLPTVDQVVRDAVQLASEIVFRRGRDLSAGGRGAAMATPGVGTVAHLLPQGVREGGDLGAEEVELSVQMIGLLLSDLPVVLGAIGQGSFCRPLRFNVTEGVVLEREFGNCAVMQFRRHYPDCLDFFT